MNRYKDTPELEARMHSPLMERIVELKENFYAESGKYDYAPQNFATCWPSPSLPSGA